MKRQYFWGKKHVISYSLLYFYYNLIFFLMKDALQVSAYVT